MRRLRRTVGILLTVASVGGATILVRPGVTNAGDHGDTPQTVLDTNGDLTDFYAFMRPAEVDAGVFAPSSHLVLIATFRPDSTSSTSFPENLEYQFDIRGASGDGRSVLSNPAVQVVCRFATTDGGAQQVICQGGGRFATVPVGSVTGSPADPLRVFAGVRADPAFFDRDAIRESLQSGNLKLKPAGTNPFAGKGVLALVVEIETSALTLGGDAAALPVLAVSARTARVVLD